MNKLRSFLLLIFFTPIFAQAQVDTTQNLFRFGTSEMLALPPDVADIQVTTASKNAESLRDAMATLTVVNGYEIEGYGALSLSDVLDRLAGTYIMGSYFMPNNLVSLRSDATGTFNTHVLILINGRPARGNMFNGFNNFAYNGMPLSSIERVEIIRGPGSVLYGSGAFAGVINIITKQGRKQETQAYHTLGSFGTRLTEVSTGFDYKQSKFAIGLRSLSSEGWDFGAFDEDSLYVAGRVADYALGANVSFQYKNLHINSLGAIDRKKSFADVGFESHELPNDITNYRFFNDITYTKALTNWWTLEASMTYNYSEYVQDEANDSLPARKNNIEDVGVGNDFLFEVANYFKPTKNLNLIAGGLLNDQTGYFEDHGISLDGTEFEYKTGRRNPNPFISIPKYNNIWASIYAQGDYTIKDKFKFTAGGQYNITRGKTSLVPRLGVIFKPTNTLTTKLLFGQAFRNSSAFEALSREDEAYGNANLLPELSTTSEINVSFANKKKTIYTSLTGYYTQVKAKIGLSDPADSLFIFPLTGESIPLYINGSPIEYYGLEFEGKYNLTKYLQLTNSITLQEAVFGIKENGHGSSTNDGDGGKLYQATGIPSIMFKTGLLYRNSRYGLNIGLFHSYFSSTKPLNQYDIDGHKIEEQKAYNPNPKAYHYVSLNVQANLKTLLRLDNIPNVSAGIFIQNLLNEEIFHPDYYRSEVNSVPGRAGRGIYGRLAVRF